jgi:hypothetical protein
LRFAILEELDGGVSLDTKLLSKTGFLGGIDLSETDL